MESIQISAKVIGVLAMPDFCPRCFWIKLHTKKLPWQIFPGIFSSIDAYTKKVVHEWIDRDSGPDFLKDYGVKGYQKVPHWSKFKTETKYGIVLSGVPDDIWTCEHGIVVPDYKTAKYTENADKLLPMYRVQNNGYAKIAKAIGYPPVIAIPLIYMEPQTDDVEVKFSSQWENVFTMAFKPKVLPVEIDADSLDPLLERARKIYDSAKAPDRMDGCKDCDALQGIIGLF